SRKMHMRRFTRFNSSIRCLALLASACGLLAQPAAGQQPGRSGGAQAQYVAGQFAQTQAAQAQSAPGVQGQAAQAQAMQGQAAGAAVPGAAAAGAAVAGAAGSLPADSGDGAVNPVAPFPPLNEQWQAYLDKVLAAWEQKSGEVTRYSCTFKRFQYDPTLVEKDAYTVAAGVVKYMNPDKGLFRVDELVYYSGRDKNNKPQYKENTQRKFGEYWICDGKYVHILDQNEKKCTKHELPPSMRGHAIYLSPLPFLFGVKAQEIKSRYWVRPLPTPEGRKDEVWLEAYPRRADDAGNYQRVQVVLDLKDFMPKGLIVFLPNWRPDAQHSELYEFEDRKINQNVLERLNIFQQEFIPAEPPKDWKVIVEPYQAPQSEEPRVATPPAAAAPVR
ncbi:MAG: TIGR03009 domain-containing protein, partial [Aureliella sp.]